MNFVKRVSSHPSAVFILGSRSIVVKERTIIISLGHTLYQLPFLSKTRLASFGFDT